MHQLANSNFRELRTEGQTNNVFCRGANEVWKAIGYVMSGRRTGRYGRTRVFSGSLSSNP